MPESTTDHVVRPSPSGITPPPQPVTPRPQPAPAPEAAAPAPAPAEPVKNGELIQAAVKKLHDELSALASEHEFEVGDLHRFDLEFDVFDPVTGMVMSPARAHRRDIGDAGQLMPAGAVVNDIVSARQHQKVAGVTQYSTGPVVPAPASNGGQNGTKSS